MTAPKLSLYRTWVESVERPCLVNIEPLGTSVVSATKRQASWGRCAAPPISVFYSLTKLSACYPPRVSAIILLSRTCGYRNARYLHTGQSGSCHHLDWT